MRERTFLTCIVTKLCQPALGDFRRESLSQGWLEIRRDLDHQKRSFKMLDAF